MKSLRIQFAAFWFLWLPAVIWLAEWTGQGGYPLRHPYFSLMLGVSPELTATTAVVSTVRSLCVYFWLAAFVPALLLGYQYFGRNVVNRSVTATGLWKFGPVIYVGCYLSLSFWVALQKPASAFRYSKPSLAAVALVAIITALWLFKRLGRTNQPRIDFRKLTTATAFNLLVPILILLTGIPTKWEISPHASLSVAKKTNPSFLLFSMDSVPGVYFSAGSGKSAVMRNWQKHWESESLSFQNAYTVTNSTFTAWYSIFSGQYPFHTGVESLFPNKRTGRVPQKDLLPSRLKDMGYQTVMMSDCGATSFMGEFQFDRKQIRGLGPYGCARSAIIGTHFLDFVPGVIGLGSLLPETDSFCSPLYRANLFFDDVIKEYERLQSRSSPFLLVIHTCLPHRTAQVHLPPVGSELRNNLPKPSKFPSRERRQVFQSLRLLDVHLHRLLATRKKSVNRPWVFILADHGVFIKKRGNKLSGFTHGTGPPLVRHQYHVPLAIMAPNSHQKLLTGTRSQVVTLMDLYPTILKLAGVKGFHSDGIDLLGRLPEARGIVLSTANYPSSFESKHWPKYRIIDNSIRMPLDIEQKMLKQRPVAYLKLPYRLLRYPDGGLKLFNELRDPYHMRNVSQKFQRSTHELNAELCRVYPFGNCRNRLSPGNVHQVPKTRTKLETTSLVSP